jgi:hypothetical protein
MRRSWIPLAGVLLILITLPVAAAIPPEAVAPDNMAMAITQPLSGVPSSPILGGDADGRLPESGLIVLVGTALMGLASIVRRSTRI